MTRYFLVSLFAALLAFATNTFATVIALEGSTPQHAPVKVTFPNPISVQVLDDEGRPVPGASVRYYVSFLSDLILESPVGCLWDLGYTCVKSTDGNGVATLHTLHANAAGEYRLRVIADIGVSTNPYNAGTPLGEAVITLIADPLAELGRLTIISGNDQRAVKGSAFAEPFVVHSEYADGSPIANAGVLFTVVRTVGYATGYFLGPNGINSSGGVSIGRTSVVSMRTDAHGNASAGPLTAELGIGTGRVDVKVFDERAVAWTTIPITFTVTNADGGDDLALQNMWWSPAEAGWGLSIVKHGPQMFPMVFTYDSNGKPTWYVMPDGRWTNGIGSWFYGAFYTAKGSPFYAYDPSRFTLTRLGDMTLAFPGDATGSLTMDFHTNPLRIFGTARKNIEPFEFASDVDTAIRGVGDMWWGGDDQAGWGISILEQPGRLFSIWFTYDDMGDPTWFVMSDGKWTSTNTFEGRIGRASGSAWVNAAYDASRFVERDVGSYRLTFSGTNSARFDYSVDGREGSLPLVRFDF
jgi:hypothetical protein